MPACSIAPQRQSRFRTARRSPRSSLEPPEPPNRYERRRPGELVHVDVKKLGRFAAAGKRVIGQRQHSRGWGWEHCHICIDDATRLAYVEVLASAERRLTLGSWLDRYNYRRKHGSLGHRPPAARLAELLGNNLARNYS